MPRTHPAFGSLHGVVVLIVCIGSGYGERALWRCPNGHPLGAEYSVMQQLKQILAKESLVSDLPHQQCVICNLKPKEQATYHLLYNSSYQFEDRPPIPLAITHSQIRNESILSINMRSTHVYRSPKFGVE